MTQVLDAGSPKKVAESRKLIRKAIETRGGIVSYQAVQEFFNVALRRFAKPMTSLEAEQYLATTFVPLLSVHFSPACASHPGSTSRGTTP